MIDKWDIVHLIQQYIFNESINKEADLKTIVEGCDQAFCIIQERNRVEFDNIVSGFFMRVFNENIH